MQFVEAEILGPMNQEDGGSQGRGCGAVHQESADKLCGFCLRYNPHVKPLFRLGESAKSFQEKKCKIKESQG